MRCCTTGFLLVVVVVCCYCAPALGLPVKSDSLRRLRFAEMRSRVGNSQLCLKLVPHLGKPQPLESFCAQAAAGTGTAAAATAATTATADDVELCTYMVAPLLEQFHADYPGVQQPCESKVLLAMMASVAKKAAPKNKFDAKLALASVRDETHHQRVGLEIELPDYFVFAYQPKVKAEERLGPVAYDDVIAVSKATQMGIPLLKLQPDGIRKHEVPITEYSWVAGVPAPKSNSATAAAPAAATSVSPDVTEDNDAADATKVPAASATPSASPAPSASSGAQTGAAQSKSAASAAPSGRKRAKASAKNEEFRYLDDTIEKYGGSREAGFRGRLEVVTGPFSIGAGSEAAQRTAEVLRQLQAAINEVTSKCTGPDVYKDFPLYYEESGNLPEPAPVSAVPLSMAIDIFNKKIHDSDLAEYQLDIQPVEVDTKEDPGYSWVLLCSTKSNAATELRQSVQVNVEMPLASVLKQGFLDVFTSDNPAVSDVSREAFKAAVATVDAYGKQPKATVFASDNDAKALLTLLMRNVLVSAYYEKLSGREKPTSAKRFHDALVKSNLPDLVRTMHSTTKAALRAWWQSVMEQDEHLLTVPGKIVTPCAEALKDSPWAKDIEFANDYSGIRVELSLALRTTFGVDGCAGRFAQETAAAYGTGVLLPTGPPLKSCWVSGVSPTRVLPVRSNPNAASSADIVVEIRNVHGTINEGFRIGAAPAKLNSAVQLVIALQQNPSKESVAKEKNSAAAQGSSAGATAAATAAGPVPPPTDK